MSRGLVSNTQIYTSCAYHSGQAISNFCKCRQCLLPVCSICMQLHSEQHRGKGSQPRYQQLGKVVAEIEQTYLSFQKQIQSLKQLLLEMQNDKKINQTQMRNRLLEHRNRMVKDFELALIELQNGLISQIVQDDETFIGELQRIDSQLSIISRGIQSGRAQLNSNNILKEIILFFSKQTASIYTSELQSLKSTAQGLIRQNVIVTVDDAQLIAVKAAVRKFIRIGINNIQ